MGINSSKIVATGYEGLGFSIPIDEAEPVINSLKQYGYVKDRAMLGISGQYLDAMSARMYGLTQGHVAWRRSPMSPSEGGHRSGLRHHKDRRHGGHQPGDHHQLCEH